MHSFSLAVSKPSPASCRRIVHIIVNRIIPFLPRTRIYDLAGRSRRPQMDRSIFDTIAMARSAARIVALLKSVQESKPMTDLVDNHFTIRAWGQRVPVEAATVAFVLIPWVRSRE